MCLELVVLLGHVDCPGKLFSLGFVVDLLDGHAPLLAPAIEGKMNRLNIKLSTQLIPLQGSAIIYSVCNL